MRRFMLLVGLLWLPIGAVQAHLLNMTKVQISIDADGGVVADLQVDLSRSAGGGLTYYRFSRVAQPLQDPEVRALLDRLGDAIALHWGEERIRLAVTSASLPDVSKEAFLDPLSWPMTQIQFKGALSAQWQRSQVGLQAVFQPGFHFEEPIALTFFSVPEHRSQTRWLVTSQKSARFPLPGTTLADSPRAASADRPWQFVAFGFLHILPKGLDHVLFVLGLALGARSLKSLFALVTGFTVAHSLTLGLAAVGLLRLPANVVEPLISASIVWIGVENLFPGTKVDRYRPMLVFAFGLMHGLGFASALSSLQAPQGSYLLALLGFNAGIELGQLTVIAAALCLTAWWRGKPWYRTAITLPGSATIALIATFWTLQRVLAALQG